MLIVGENNRLIVAYELNDISQWNDIFQQGMINRYLFLSRNRGCNDG
jgi:hypothetical protein